MHTEVMNYQVYFFGGPGGLWANRSKIALRGNDNKVLAHINFNDSGMKFENDSERDGITEMNLPSSMFANIIDILRNEKPVYIKFIHGHGVLQTSLEPVGEGEEKG
ncbi:MAG: hypothetical protein E4H07_04855 [Nitrosomonadales bacterium]|jgi:hypothetical protein|nr:MAG: hypothetical protein E4H07_04855 [Nitrosomonadales bacterium]